jgi:predicted nucleotidyltransferase
VDRDELLRVLKAFEGEGLEYVLVGATALAMHGIVRATEDVDLFIRATADNVERLKRALRAVYADDPNIEEIHPQDLLGEYPSVRYYPPTGDLYFDILTRLGEAARYEDIAVERKIVAGIPVWVATPRALYDLKKDTVRALDRQDAEVLRQRFLLEDR